MNYINAIKDRLKDPKKKSITLLVIYFIFFVFVFMILNNAGKGEIDVPVESEEKTLTALESYKSMNGYEYKIIFTNNEIDNLIDGTYYEKKSLFNYNGMKYYYDNNLYVIDNDIYYLSNIDYNISKLFNDNLYSIFENLTLVSETKYTDGTIKKNYTMDSNIFYNYYYGKESYYTNTISLEITELNNLITDIKIDLTNLGIELSKIEVLYSNINNIKALEFNKENYIYRE